MTNLKTFTNTMQNIVEEFQVTFGHPAKVKPTLPTLERFTNRKGWGTIEECIEQLFVLSNSYEEFEEVIDAIHSYVNKAKDKQMSKELIVDETDKIVALGDGLGDELWFLLGDAVESGIDIEPIIDIIRLSNLSKLYTNPETGEKYAKMDENGKIMKSPDFFAPEDAIKEEIIRQIKGITSVQQLIFTFDYAEFIERLGFDNITDKLVNAGMDNDNTTIIQCYGFIHGELNAHPSLKLAYVDNDEILELLEYDHDSINLQDENYEYELAYVGTDLASQKVFVRVQKTYIEE